MNYLPAPGDTVRTLEFEYQDVRGAHFATKVGTVKTCASHANGITVIFEDGRRADLDYGNGMDRATQITEEDFAQRNALLLEAHRLLHFTPDSIREHPTVKEAARILKKASGLS